MNGKSARRFWLSMTTSAAALLAAIHGASAETAPGGSVALEQIDVQGVGEDDGQGPFPGLLANTSTAGTKTDTPIMETPQSITIIGRDRLDTFQSTNVNEALRYTPGVAPDVYGVDQRSDNYLTIRGLPANFFLDNLQLPLMPPYGSWRVDPWSVERIEVLRGPASILYGQGSPGGTVNYVSKRPTDKPLLVIEPLYGTNGRVQLGIDQGGPIDPKGEFAYRITALGFRTDLDFGDPFEGKRVAFTPSFRWRPDAKTSFTLFATYLRDNTSVNANFLPARGTVLFNPNGQISRNTWLGSPDFDRYDKEQWSIGYEFAHDINQIWTVRQNLRLAHIDSTIKTVYGAGLYPGSDSEIIRLAAKAYPTADRFEADNQAQAKFDFGPSTQTLLLGVDYSHQRTRDKQDYNFVPYLFNAYSPSYPSLWDLTLYPAQDPTQTLDQVGLYMQDQVKIYDKLVITGGARYDIARSSYRDPVATNDTVYNNNYVWSPRIGAVYLFDNGFAPYVSYSQSFLPNVGSNAEGVPFAPSFGKQKEIGVRYRPPGTQSQLSAALYDIDQTNVISQTGATILDAFAQDLKSRGLELEALLQFDLGYRVIGSFTYQNVTVAGNQDPAISGKRPVAVPNQMLQLWADYKFPTGPLAGFRFGGGLRWYGDSAGDVTNTFMVPNFTLVDTGISYELQNWRFAFNVNNVLNRDYIAACGGETACFYGNGRKVLASVRYTW
jgi:iron complex outermembrane receptor protein